MTLSDKGKAFISLVVDFLFENISDLSERQLHELELLLQQEKSYRSIVN